MPNPTFDRDSEKRQEAQDRAIRRMSDGGFEMDDVRNALFNLPMTTRLQIISSIQDGDLILTGRLVNNAVLQWLTEQEHEG